MMLSYIIQAIVFQLIFLLVYDALLKRETFFNLNRAYLLVTPILAMVLPLIKIDMFNAIIPEQLQINLPTVFLGNSNAADNGIASQLLLESSTMSLWNVWSIIGIGMSIALLLTVAKLYKIYALITNNPKRWKRHFWLVNVQNSETAFSFFNYICLGDQIKGNDRKTILQHEEIHVRQKHSVDLLLFELLRVVFWFNPLVYLYQNRISILHEYIADNEAIKHQSKANYYTNLLAQVFETENTSFINTFYKKSLIKKRIIMLNKNKSNRKQSLKYLAVLPILFGMLVFTSCNDDVLGQDQNTEENLEKRIEAFRSHIKNLEFDKITENEIEEFTLLAEQAKSLGIKVMLTSSRENGVELLVGEDLIKEKTAFLNAKTNNSTSEMPIPKIDQVPIFPGCESGSNKEQKDCLIQKITDFVQRNFNKEILNSKGLSGKQRIITAFKIDKDGRVVDIKVRAPHPDLQVEAERVISALPKMIPGEHNGEKVIVPYSLPIAFLINE